MELPILLASVSADTTIPWAALIGGREPRAAEYEPLSGSTVVRDTPALPVDWECLGFAAETVNIVTAASTPNVNTTLIKGVLNVAGIGFFLPD
jgi:hypothetical protein